MNTCKILKSDHSDVQVGTMGKVVQTFEGGYGVEIQGRFAKADTPNKREEDKRTIYFRKDQIQILG